MIGDHIESCALEHRVPQQSDVAGPFNQTPEGIVVPGGAGTPAEGEITHSELLWPEGGRVMVASTRAVDDHATGDRACLYVVTDHPDEVHARAVELGAEITRPLGDQNGYVSREFSMKDPDGNAWSFGTYGG